MAAAGTEIGIQTLVEPLKETVASERTGLSAAYNGSGPISKLLDKGIAAGLLAAVVFTALAHGAVEPWAAAIFNLIIISLLAAWGLKAVIDKKLSLKIPQTALPLAALAVVSIAQSLAFTGSDGTRHSLSMDVEATRNSFVAIVIMLASCLIAANFLSTHKRARRLSHFLVAFGFAMAMFAIIQSLAWNGKFFWLRENSVGTSPFGPFVSHNNFAGFMELLVPIPIALIITHAFRAEVRLFYGFAAALMAISIVASMSRGGIISLVAGLIFLGLMSPVTRPDHVSTRGKRRHGLSLRGVSINGRHFSLLKSGLTVVCLAAAITVGVIWMGSDKLGGPVAAPQSEALQPSQETFYKSRGWIWRDTLSIIKARPLTGVGLGAFATAYPIYSRSDGTIGVDRAHNDYLQLLAECGPLGGAIVLWFIWLMSRAVIRGISTHDRLLAGLALGGGAGIFSLLVHSIFDFNLQLPSNALLFLVISTIVSLIGADLVRAEKKLAHHPRSATTLDTRRGMLQESTQ